MKKLVVYNDIHFPYQDDRVLKLLKKFLKWFKPDIIVNAGDMLDFSSISKFTKDPLDTHSVEDELKLARGHLREFRRLAKEYYFIEGNHEWRLNKYLADKSKELADLTDGEERVLTLNHLLRLNELAINFIPMVGREAYTRFNDILVGHFNVARKHSCYSSKALLEDKGISLITGHTHRLGVHYKSNLLNNMVAIENGCLCDLHPAYIQNPNWQHGITVVYLDDNGRRFQAYNIPIVDYKFYFGDKKFEVKDEGERI